MATLPRLIAVSAPLYFTWEMLQAPAFTGMPDDWKLATVWCALATVADVAIAIVLFGVAALVSRDSRWFARRSLPRYAAVVAAGVAIQILVEWIAVDWIGLWGYRAWQPRLPVTGTGILTVLQPVVLLPLTFWLLARWYGGRKRSAVTG